ncbi:ATP-binding cassette domain-containing protein [Oscillatoria sp. CS-180]|uniref:ABC transporter ATP-binding protein n=1 Tax=Oscillatoria sp. CS-180 TaxID=3021720 RepID=UPI00232AE31A|nr:ATP-binding cassette domain-containing protein [Oscillatoria sp. CS-180]MDB9525665.1 ATP-binding cassette domain-containing protein [Oscillatoria sp. CS-180]
MSTLLELDNVSLKATTGNHLILDSISLSVGSGELVALLGPSGAGKSSLLRLLNRLQSPSSGVIRFQGQPIEAIAVYELRRQAMLLNQDVRLLGMTAMEALHYPLVLQKLPVAERNRRVAECIDMLRIPTEWLEKTELELSGGQQQQVAIARALVTRPALLLMDEPTSALDLGSASRILSMIKSRIQEQGMTVIMSNHQIDLVKEFCDRILYVEQGRLLSDKATSAVDWASLRQTLVDADLKEREDWGEDFD